MGGQQPGGPGPEQRRRQVPGQRREHQARARPACPGTWSRPRCRRAAVSPAAAVPASSETSACPPSCAIVIAFLVRCQNQPFRTTISATAPVTATTQSGGAGCVPVARSQRCCSTVNTGIPDRLGGLGQLRVRDRRSGQFLSNGPGRLTTVRPRAPRCRAPGRAHAARRSRPAGSGGAVQRSAQCQAAFSSWTSCLAATPRPARGRARRAAAAAGAGRPPRRSAGSTAGARRVRPAGGRGGTGRRGGPGAGAGRSRRCR